MKKTGSIVWHDLTVDNADILSEFYSRVVGWRRDALKEEGGDFNMYMTDSDEPVAGICYARGVNAGLPAQWLCYVSVDDIFQSISQCEQMGGRLVNGPRTMGTHTFCVIQDPAGAFLALASMIAPDMV